MHVSKNMHPGAFHQRYWTASSAWLQLEHILKLLKFSRHNKNSTSGVEAFHETFR